MPESARPLRVPLASLPLGERVRVRMGERPVELVRGPDHVRARSLWCTHMGCEVAWEPAKDRYCCGCHGGEFDEDGEPVAGPPERPLRVLVTHFEGTDVVIDPPGAAS